LRFYLGRKALNQTSWSELKPGFVGEDMYWRVPRRFGPPRTPWRFHLHSPRVSLSGLIILSIPPVELMTAKFMPCSQTQAWFFQSRLTSTTILSISRMTHSACANSCQKSRGRLFNANMIRFQATRGSTAQFHTPGEIIRRSDGSGSMDSHSWSKPIFSPLSRQFEESTLSF